MSISSAGWQKKQRDIAKQQAASTAQTMNRVNQYLDYAASQEEDTLTYEASNDIGSP